MRSLVKPVLLANMPTAKVIYLESTYPIPTHSNKNMEGCHVDFVEGLPKSLEVDMILVVVDKLYRFGNFLSL